MQCTRFSGLRRSLAGFLSLVVCLSLTTGMADSQSAPERNTLVWAVDGFSYEAFQLARQRGLFSRFRHAGRHVAPFPSMSHPSWTEVTGARELFGARGNIRTVEASRFDLDAMRVESDPRQVFSRQAAPFNYMRSFDWYYDPVTEPLMYFEGDRLADLELQEAERHLLDDYQGGQQVVFLGAADAIAHTHLGRLHAYLRRLDAMMSRTIDSLARRGMVVDSWIVSDHGNAGAFVEGQPERRLTPVSLDAAFRAARLVRRDTGRLSAANEVSVVTLALASMVNVYFADLSRRRLFAQRVLDQPGTDLVTWLEVAPDDRRIVILSRTAGEAHLRWRDDGTASYRVVTGNPLRLPERVLARDGDRWISDSLLRLAGRDGPYPDAVFRLIRSASKDVENAPDLIVSLQDGFCWAGTLGRYVKMVRTHGALGARSTLGLVASTTTPVPHSVRSGEIRSLMGLDARALFRRIASRAPHDARTLADSLATTPPLIPTGRSDTHVDAAFLRRVRPITASAEYFDGDALQSLASATKRDSTARANGNRRITRTRRALRRTDVVAGVTKHIDTLLALTDSLPARSANAAGADGPAEWTPWLEGVERRIRGIPGLAPLAELRSIWRGASGPSQTRAAARTALMAAWTFPYYADAALFAPETDSIPDTRDRQFAGTWHASMREAVRRTPGMLLSDSGLAPRVFREVLEERELTRKVEGATVPMLYDAPPADLAIVYVPGIFGELFDDEIWRRGLRALREQLGARVIPAGTDGRCSATDNATRLLATLHRDTRHRLERGYARPRYLIVGYSKGGVDAAEALARDTTLADSQIVALVTIASPHGGTPVAERADLSDALLEAVVARPRPATCDTTRAVESLWPANRAAFWGTHGARLAARIPLVSVALTSDMQGAHPWMKITKRIAQFSEPNDGVVSQRAARFPSSVPSIHLGSLTGDHIAARGASSFPQESVLEAVVLSLNELGLFDADGTSRWRAAVAASRTATDAEGSSRSAGTSLDMRRAGPSAATATATRTPTQLPDSTGGWRPDRTFRMNNLEVLADRAIAEATPANLPDGIAVTCDQPSIVDFRREYEFLYDAGNGGSDDTQASGFSIVSDSGTVSGRACRLRTTRTAMKMTTVAFRFRPDAFPELQLRANVLHGVRGATAAKGGRGRNDASLKIWYVLRDERPEAKGRRVLFGYMWTVPDANGNAPASDSLTEGSASRRRIAFSVLPEAWVMHVGSAAPPGTWHTVQRDFAADVQRAFPGIPIDQLRVIAMTVQTDSDDSDGRSDVLLDQLVMRPRRR